jgi:hypothetical protein
MVPDEEEIEIRGREPTQDASDGTHPIRSALPSSVFARPRGDHPASRSQGREIGAPELCRFFVGRVATRRELPQRVGESLKLRDQFCIFVVGRRRVICLHSVPP